MVYTTGNILVEDTTGVAVEVGATPVRDKASLGREYLGDDKRCSANDDWIWSTDGFLNYSGGTNHSNSAVTA